MSLRLVLTADTHLPRRARDLPGPLWAAIDAADVVVHAGDWVTVDLLDALEARAARLVGVHGNNDGPALRARLPEVARTDPGGVRFAVVHETGAATGRTTSGPRGMSPNQRSTIGFAEAASMSPASTSTTLLGA